MSEHTIKNIFLPGPISASFIAQNIQQHNNKHQIGGHSIFLGQVRADVINDKTITAIEYSGNEVLALNTMHGIRNEIFSNYDLTCMHVFHSLGMVAAGEICLFVFTSGRHRKAAIDACAETVEKIKAMLPIWGKEIFGDDSHQWKVNT